MALSAKEANETLLGRKQSKLQSDFCTAPKMKIQTKYLKEVWEPKKYKSEEQLC